MELSGAAAVLGEATSGSAEGSSTDGSEGMDGSGFVTGGSE